MNGKPEPMLLGHSSSAHRPSPACSMNSRGAPYGVLEQDADGIGKLRQVVTLFGELLEAVEICGSLWRIDPVNRENQIFLPCHDSGAPPRRYIPIDDLRVCQVFVG